MNIYKIINNNLKVVSFKNLAVFILLAMFLVACSGSQNFYFNKKFLDPFSVENSLPLDIPPIYYLSSSEIVNNNRDLQDNQNNVQRLLFSDDNLSLPVRSSTTKSNLSNSDIDFLTALGAQGDYSNIRSIVNKEILGTIQLDNKTINNIFAHNNAFEGLENKIAEYNRLNNKN